MYQHKDGAADPLGWGVWGPGPRDPGRAGSWVPWGESREPCGAHGGAGPTGPVDTDSMVLRAHDSSRGPQNVISFPFFN